MAKYIDSDRLKAEIKRLKKHSEESKKEWVGEGYNQNAFAEDCRISSFDKLLSFIDSLQQEQQMPDSTQIIAEWEKEKAVLEQKDFRGDAERMAYNAFLDGFVKGLGYEGTK